MRDIGVSVDHEMVQRGIQFLLDTYDADLGCWPQVPPSVDDYPHAPWWTFNPEAAQEKGFRANAGAEKLWGIFGIIEPWCPTIF